VDSPGYDGTYVSVRDIAREVLNHYPWPISNPVATTLRERMESAAVGMLGQAAETFGYTGQTNADGAFLAPRLSLERRGVETSVIRDFVTGDDVRDFRIKRGSAAIFPYSGGKLAHIDGLPGAKRWLWPVRSATWSRATFSKQTYRQEGRTWWEWHQVALGRVGRWAITFPSVATGVHFSLDREGRVFNRHAAFIQLNRGTSEGWHLGLTGCSTPHPPVSG
jgi:hypothetical protein